VTLDQEGLVFGTAPEFRRAAAGTKASHLDEIAINRKRAKTIHVEQRRIVEHHPQKHEGEEQVDDQRQRRAGEKIANVSKFATRATESPTRRA
jgi:hypothetical protein